MLEDNLKRCSIERYDTTILEPPFLTIHIDEVEVDEPKHDDGGSIFAERLREACASKGYIFRFYTLASKSAKFDYILVVI